MKVTESIDENGVKKTTMTFNLWDAVRSWIKHRFHRCDVFCPRCYLARCDWNAAHGKR
jgi:hypothetical protein